MSGRARVWIAVPTDPLDTFEQWFAKFVETEKVDVQFGNQGSPLEQLKAQCRMIWDARQPEIDELKRQLAAVQPKS
jgi:hypothetical protein